MGNHPGWGDTGVCVWAGAMAAAAFFSVLPVGVEWCDVCSVVLAECSGAVVVHFGGRFAVYLGDDPLCA